MMGFIDCGRNARSVAMLGLNGAGKVGIIGAQFSSRAALRKAKRCSIASIFADWS
jgi:hypothetical protein